MAEPTAIIREALLEATDRLKDCEHGFLFGVFAEGAFMALTALDEKRQGLTQENEHLKNALSTKEDRTQEILRELEAAEAQVEQWKIDHPGCYEQMQSVGALQRERDMFMDSYNRAQDRVTNLEAQVQELEHERGIWREALGHQTNAMSSMESRYEAQVAALSEAAEAHLDATVFDGPVQAPTWIALQDALSPGKEAPNG